MENEQKIKDLAKFYETLINHTETLASLCINKEEVYKNIDKIKELNEFHKGTREIGKVLLSEDLSKLSSNILFKLMSKDMTATSIMFINLVTEYNEKLIVLAESNNLEEINKLINELQEFNIIVKKNFKKFLNLINKLN